VERKGMDIPGIPWILKLISNPENSGEDSK
jgi:hypothetical protein